MLVCYFQKFTPLCLLFFSPARLLFFEFCPFCLFIRFSIKRQMELPNCEQDLLLNGKGYISSQTMQSANSEPKLSLIVLLFDTFSPAHLLDFQKKIHTARLFHAARLLIFFCPWKVEETMFKSSSWFIIGFFSRLKGPYLTEIGISRAHPVSSLYTPYLGCVKAESKVVQLVMTNATFLAV